MAKTRDQGPAALAPSGEVTRMLLAWKRGDRVALDRLSPPVYGDLQRMAGLFSFSP